MKDVMLMTPGPTSVKENVRLARAMETTNPDLDPKFYDFYKETCVKIGRFLGTDNEVLILSGEGILGLEAACASLTEPGDRVLVLDNGVFGEGFQDFVKLYGGKVEFFKGSRKRAIDIDALKAFLDKDSNFKYATVVHCDTPSGVLNDISKICPLLKSYGIATVVDTVAAMGGEKVEIDKWQIDIALGASQKALSTPPGLTIVAVSKDAFDMMNNRKTPIASFYCNLAVWQGYYENKWCPYTPPVSDIMGLAVAIDNVIEEGEEIFNRHAKIGKATRTAVKKAGLNLFIEDGYSNTVTAIEVPEGVKSEEITKYMLDKHKVFIAGSFGEFKGKVVRIGHMGNNCYDDKMVYTLNALQEAFKSQGVKIKEDMVATFLSEINK